MDMKQYAYITLIVAAVAVILVSLQAALAGEKQLAVFVSMIFGLFLVAIVFVRIYRYMPPAR